MKVEQIAVFLENKSGRLAEVAAVLSEKGLNIRALSLADTADFGILRLIVDNTTRAVEVLKEKGFTVSRASVVAVEVADRPGGLADVLNTLNEAAINVEYMYAFVEKSGQNAVIIFRFDDPDAAIAVLLESGLRVLSSEQVCSL